MKSITRQEWYGALVAVIVLGVLLTFASPYFLTTGNLSNILVQASVIDVSKAQDSIAWRWRKRSGICAQTWRFSSSVARLQLPISGNVLKQPSQCPPSGCIRHTDTQGDGTWGSSNAST